MIYGWFFLSAFFWFLGVMMFVANTGLLFCTDAALPKSYLDLFRVVSQQLAKPVGDDLCTVTANHAGCEAVTLSLDIKTASAVDVVQFYADITALLLSDKAALENQANAIGKTFKWDKSPIFGAMPLALEVEDPALSD